MLVHTRVDVRACCPVPVAELQSYSCTRRTVTRSTRKRAAEHRTTGRSRSRPRPGDGPLTRQHTGAPYRCAGLCRNAANRERAHSYAHTQTCARHTRAREKSDGASSWCVSGLGSPPGQRRAHPRNAHPARACLTLLSTPDDHRSGDAETARVSNDRVTSRREEMPHAAWHGNREPAHLF